MSTLNSKTFNAVHWNWPEAVLVTPTGVPACISARWPDYAVTAEWPAVAVAARWPDYAVAAEWQGITVIARWPDYAVFQLDLEC